MKNYLFVFLGGGFGAAARYWLSGAAFKVLPTDFPYGNLVVNVTGCLVIGILMSSMQDRFMFDPSLRIFLTIGILGGFTTFSSFSYETIALLQNGSYLEGVTNVIASVFLCLGATWLGGTMGKLF